MGDNIITFTYMCAGVMVLIMCSQKLSQTVMGVQSANLVGKVILNSPKKEYLMVFCIFRNKSSPPATFTCTTLARPRRHMDMSLKGLWTGYAKELPTRLTRG